MADKIDSYYHAPDETLVALTNRILDQHDNILKMNARLLQSLAGSAIIINSESQPAEGD